MVLCDLQHTDFTKSGQDCQDNAHTSEKYPLSYKTAISLIKSSFDISDPAFSIEQQLGRVIAMSTADWEETKILNSFVLHFCNSNDSDMERTLAAYHSVGGTAIICRDS